MSKSSRIGNTLVIYRNLLNYKFVYLKYKLKIKYIFTLFLSIKYGI